MTVPIKKVVIGNLPKEDLLHELAKHDVLINPLGEKLFSDNAFSLSTKSYTVNIVERTVSELGFPDGASLNEIYDNALKEGLTLCPTELGPYLRLAYLDQPAITLTTNVKQHKAPEGSLTVASPIIKADHEFPKGFYLRNIEGQLWLRGYICDDLHIWNPEDRLIFAVKY